MNPRRRPLGPTLARMGCTWAAAWALVGLGAGELAQARPPRPPAESSEGTWPAARPLPPPPHLAVLILSGEASGVAWSDLYGAVRDALETHTRIAVLPLESITASARSAAVGGCAGDPACFARRISMEVQPLELLLTVSVQTLSSTTLLAVRLVDAKTGEALGAAAGEVPGGMSVLAAARDRLSQVVPSRWWDRVGALEVRVEPRGTEVRAAGRTCVSPCRLRRLPAGRFQVELKARRHRSETRIVNVRPSGTDPLQLALQRERSVWKSPWLWSAVAVVAAGAIAGSVAATQAGGGGEGIRIQVDGAP